MGKHLSELPLNFSTIVEILRYRANERPKQKAYSFLLDGEVEEAHLTYGELDCQARAICLMLQSREISSGERALLLYPPGLEYITAFFGCLYAGVVAVPAYPPRLNRPMPRLEAIVADAEATVALTTTNILTQMEHQWLQAPNLKAVQWLVTDSIPIEPEDRWQETPLLGGDRLAFLQYTSGSTATPKGVMVSHGNLLHNQRIIQQAMGHTSKTIFVGWLPLFHDMGLIGNMLQPLYLGIPCILMSPFAFLQRPLRWLQAISQYKATTSGGPNFAYDLCVSKISHEQRATLDLSSWDVAFNGSEPIRANTLERFAAAFQECGFRREAFYPCYGLAETTLIVSGGFKLAPPVLQPVQQSALAQNRVVLSGQEDIDTQTLVGCGQQLQDMQIIVTHPDTLTRCMPCEVGEIWVAGTSVAQGYWNQTEQTEEIFQAYLKDTGEGPFLRTGDLGFLREGELFITGRLKDLIVIRGRNHYPQDIEWTIEHSHPALQPSHSAAFSIEVVGEERLVVAIEVRRTHLRNLDIDQIIRAIRQAAVEEHELQVYGVLLLKTGSIPKTSSGKIQRHACRVGFLDGSLDIVGSSILEQSDFTVSDLTGATLLALELEEQQLRLASYLKDLGAQVLKIAPSELDSQQPLSTIGLDSLMAIELQNGIETKLGIVLPMASILEGLSIDQLVTEVLAQLRTPLPPEVVLAPAQETVTEYPLSYGQQALWFLHQLSPESPAYNIVNAVRLHAELNIAALQCALQALVQRHPTLRTTFSASQGKAQQRIHEHLEIFFQQEDASTWSEEFLNNRLIVEAHYPFNLEQGSLLRVNLFTRSSNEHILLLAVHHIVADFWSLAIFVDELGVLYQAEKAGIQHALFPLPLQYTDYAYWQAQMIASETGKRLWAYWQKQLAGELPVLNIPTDRPRPPIQSYRGASYLFRLSADLTQKLKALTHAHGVTLYMTLLAAFQVLLYRYTGQEDILVGSPTTGRSRAHLAGLVGYFINPVVCRADISGNPSFETFLSQVRSSVLDAFKHQDYPFARLVEQLQPMRDSSHSPLFQVMFVLQKAQLLKDESLAAFALGETGAKIKLGDLELESLSLEKRIAQFDLTLMMAEVDGALSASWQYNTDLFDAATIARMANHFQTLLESIVVDPQQRVSNLPLLTTAEQHQLLVEWNDPRSQELGGILNSPQSVCIHHQFETQVEQTPDAVAVVFEQERLTYQELNQLANQLAHHLQTLGVEPEVLVGIYLERSVEMVVSILGILKAGGAYIPLDPTYPQERLIFMLEDATVRIVVTQNRLLEMLPAFTGSVVCLDQVRLESEENPISKVTADNLAYVIYTSGSTGKPKGVLVNHFNVIRLFTETNEWFHFSDRDVWTNFHSYAFDFSVWEIWGALLYGGRLVVVPYWITRSPEAFYNLLCTEHVTVLNQTPSAFLQLIDADAEVALSANSLSLRLIIFGGEALELKSLAPWFKRHGDQMPQLINMYGITETTVHVTYRPITSADLSQPVSSPIGYRIPDLQVYLLDSQQQLVPIGIPGELYIGGAGVTRGYLNRPDLTAERFIANPFNGVPNTHLYKSGDLARYLPNGELEYLGRIDQQVKIRGFRIELGEIKAVLNQHPAVQEAIVLIREFESKKKPQGANPVNELGDTNPINAFRRLLKGKSSETEVDGQSAQLVAYYVCNQPTIPTTSELRHFLLEKLPEYMIPSAFVLLETIPLTANGKVDQRSLPAPSRTRPELDKPFVAPRTSIEKILADIWGLVLDIEHVGIHDNFFEIGGDSIRSIQVRAKAQERGLNFSLPQLFQHQTIHNLAQEITTTEPDTHTTLRTEPFSLISEAEKQKLPSNVVDAYPLARVQAGVIFHSQYCPDLPMYHDVFLYHLQVNLDVELFQQALEQLVARHPILRTSFDLTNFSKPLQLVHQTVSVPFQVQDLRDLAPEERKKALADWIKVERNRNFDWACPPIIRFFIQRLTDDSFYFTLSCHNSILDGWSKSSLLTELLHYYYALLNGECSVEPPPIVTYRDFIALERSVIQSPESKAFWTKKLENSVTTKLPRWHSTERETDTPRIAVLDVPISTQVSDGLKKLARLAEVPLKNVLLAAHVRVMSLLSGETDILTGLESNGRLEEVDAEKTLGTHLNTVPFRLKLTGGSWVELVQQVFEAERELLPFRRFPYADLQQLSGRQPLQPLVETVFNYTHFHIFHTLQALEGLGIVGAQGFGETHFGLKVEFNRNHASDCIQLDLECDLTDISQAQLEAIGRYFSETLRVMSSQPFERYESQCLLPELEQHHMLVEWNNTATEYPQKLLIHQQIEATATHTPHEIAVDFEGEQLTYKELNRRANAIANHLQGLGVGPNVPVAICVERSWEMVVGILGILKAGGAYVPLDPAYPQEHLAFMLEDAQVPVLLTQARLVAGLPSHQAQIVCLDSWNTWTQDSTEKLINRTTPENLAYIIYTSGSTGKPKGVLVTHKNLVHSTNARLTYYQEPVTSFLLLPSFAFDSSVGCIFWTLCQGGTLVLLTEGKQRDIWQLTKAIAQHRISHWLSVPSLYNALLTHIDPTDLNCLRTVIVAGESCFRELVERHLKLLPDTPLFNEYGPTEGTVWSSVYHCQKHDLTTSVSVGRPIVNTEIYLLNSYGQPVPIGVPGELHIGGFGVAQGYLNRPELTAQKFIPNPFSNQLNSRLYRTGDLARYLPNGNIEFLGRIDHQIKLRGYRIELTEIEAVLLLHPVVREAVVSMTQEESGSKRLIAYVVSFEKSALTTNELRSFLKQKLPDYMIPTAFVKLDALPLNPNGKVDRQSLPAPEQAPSRDEKMAQILKSLAAFSEEEVKAILAKRKLSMQRQ